MKRCCQHSQHRRQGTSLAPVVIRGVLATLAGVTAVWVMTAPDAGLREYAGSLCALVLHAMMVDQIGPAMTRRREALRRVRQEEHERRSNTATWETDFGQLLQVRYEPETGRYLVHGWISEHWQVQPETEWTDTAALRSVLTDVERSGEMVWWDDKGTRAVRARLEVGPEWAEPFWNEAPDEWPWVYGGPDPVAMQETNPADTVTSLPVPVRPVIPGRFTGEETRRLDIPEGITPDTVIMPIQVPVFHTVAERDYWAHEHDIPTEVLPVQPLPAWRPYAS